MYQDSVAMGVPDEERCLLEMIMVNIPGVDNTGVKIENRNQDTG